MGLCASAEVEHPMNNSGITYDSDDSDDMRNSVPALSEKEINSRVECGVDTQSVGSTGLSLRYAYRTQRGYYPDDMSKNNQDAFKVIKNLNGNNNLAYFGVFDGHGKVGDKCSYYVRDSIEQKLKMYIGASPITDPKFDEKFSKCYTSINQEMHKSNVCGFDDLQSGTTAVSVYMEGLKLKVSNIGDSRCIVAEMQPNGKLKAIPLTQDQTPYRKDERERCKKRGARIMNMDQLDGLEPYHENWGLNLGEQCDEEGDPPRIWHATKKFPGTAFTRSIGDRLAEPLGVYSVPEITTTELNENSRFAVIASDGVWEFMPSQAVVDMVTKFKDPADACERIVRQSYDLWLTYDERTDDITCIIVHFDNITKAVKKVGSASIGTTASSATGDIAQRPVRRNFSKKKRKQIMGASNLDDDNDDDYDITKYATPKSKAEKDEIRKAIGNSFLFAHLSDLQLENVFSVMKKQTYQRGDIVIKQYDQGEDFYIVASGRYEVLVSPDKKSAAKPVIEYNGVGTFGELSLMYGKPRAATVRVIGKKGTPNVLWSLDRRSFRRLVMKSTSGDLVKTLRSVKVLKSLAVAQLKRLADLLGEERFKANDKIITQGESGDTFYVIKEGSVRCTISQDGGEEKEVLRLEKGQYFGERALLTNDKRAANVIADGKVVCLQIKRSAFEEVLGPLQALIDSDRKRREGGKGGSGKAVTRSTSFSTRKDCALVAGAGVSSMQWLNTLSTGGDVGEFGTVIERQSKKAYSMWRFNKAMVTKSNQGPLLVRSLEIMKQLNSVPSCSLPHLVATLSDKNTVNLVTVEPVTCTLDLVMEQGNFDENTAKFYAACLVSAVEALHSNSIVSRTLDPASIGVDQRGYPQLIDFRNSKQLHSNTERTTTMCGSPDYFAPEQVSPGNGHSLQVDLWALGVILYEMLVGKTPFAAENEQDVYKNIIGHIKNGIKFPPDVSQNISANCTNFINKLCMPKEQNRIAASSSKNHKWLSKTNWSAIQNGGTQSPHAAFATNELKNSKANKSITNSKIVTTASNGINEYWAESF